MAIRLQSTRSLPINPNLDVVQVFGKETECGRRTFTVLMTTPKQRAKWAWAIANIGLGIKADEVAGSAMDHKPGCGYSPRTIAFSCYGRLVDLEALADLRLTRKHGRKEEKLVLSVAYGELRIPRGMAHVGPAKQGKGKSTLDADATVRRVREMADYTRAVEDVKEEALTAHAPEDTKRFESPKMYSYFPPNERE